MWGLVYVQRTCFDYREACRRLVEIRRVNFDHHKSCRNLVLTSAVGSVLINAKGLGGLGKAVLTSVKRVRDL